MKTVKKILFICLGNICRSPAAEGAFKKIIEEKGRFSEFEVDSCGTAGYHIGELADPRTRLIAKNHGINLTHRSRQLQKKDLDYFDFLLVMDAKNYSEVAALASNPIQKQKIFFFRSFVGKGSSLEVPDPYYGTNEDFENVQKIVTESSKAFLNYLDSR